ncbi:acyltransferase [Clostridium estertheticum]|uniref:acyltransferase n=1 Tax=Clostridium estertheticum TaxID=238834 RepID=UPI001C7DA722|nr:acyltransferase [Clostridium estertheticum]MBX4265171.1 acyltransferase [Clostridium estertheticum]WLC90458.1 acyltransferase [Clostridium estertheticum]
MKEEMKVYFKHFGENNKISGNVEFNGAKGIYIGDNVDICNYTSIVVHEFCHNDNAEWNIKINEGVLVNTGSIIQAFNQIEIGKYVMLAPYVYISDNSHEYSNYNAPILVQLYKKELNKVLIKDGAWIGTGAKVIGNVTIGYGTVVAANAVVVKDVPDHCVVAGIPSEIIKICDYRSGEWINVKNKLEVFNDIQINRGIFKGYDEEVSIKVLEKKVVENKKVNTLHQDLEYDKLNLITTIEEGIIHIVNNIDVENFDQTIKILTTLVDGLTKIQPITKQMEDKPIINSMEDDLNIALSKMVSYYEKNDIETSKKVVKNSIIPICQSWKEEIKFILMGVINK